MKVNVISRPKPVNLLSQVHLCILLCIVQLFAVAARASSTESTTADFTPAEAGDWPVSSPEALGLDTAIVQKLYQNASELKTLYGLLVIKNGYLVAERYYGKGNAERKNFVQSVTKSYLSALVGVALQRKCIDSIDQKMIQFFPEFATGIRDKRKLDITIKHLLQMRAGYPWEERKEPYLKKLFFVNDWHWLPHIVNFPLTNTPGQEFGYSTLSSHILAMILARACEMDLKSFGQRYLFSALDSEIGEWRQDSDGYHWGWGEISFTAKEMGKFGLLYLNKGEYRGKRLLPVKWVDDSLNSYSEDINFTGWFSSKIGKYFEDIEYGYQWWSAAVDSTRFNFAWGHGGNLIVLLQKRNMVIVTAADPLYFQVGEESWKHEVAIINMVGEFIQSLSRD